MLFGYRFLSHSKTINPLFSINAFPRFMIFGLFCDPFSLTRAVCVTIELNIGTWMGRW